MIRTLIFDIGGVITHGDFRSVYFDFAKKLGIDGNLVEEFYQTNLPQLLIGEITTANTRTAFGLTEYSDTDILNVWRDVTLPHWEVDASMVALLQNLRERQYNVVALTNLTASRRVVDVAMNVYEHFDQVILSFEEGMRKPNLDFYRLALTRTNTPPTEAVFIDDQERHVAAARKLGIHGLVFSDCATLRAELSELGVLRAV